MMMAGQRMVARSCRPGFGYVRPMFFASVLSAPQLHSSALRGRLPIGAVPTVGLRIIAGLLRVHLSRFP